MLNLTVFLILGFWYFGPSYQNGPHWGPKGPIFNIFFISSKMMSCLNVVYILAPNCSGFDLCGSIKGALQHVHHVPMQLYQFIFLIEKVCPTQLDLHFTLWWLWIIYMSHVVSFYTVKNMQAIIELKLSFLQNMNIEAFGVLQYGKQVKMNHRTIKLRRRGLHTNALIVLSRQNW